MSPAASRKVMIGTMLTRVEEDRRGSMCNNCVKAGHVARDKSKLKGEDDGEDRGRARERKVLGNNGGSKGGHPGDELRSEFADQGQSAREDGRRKKSSKSLATPSPDSAQPQLNQTVTRGARGRNLSSMMETMIDRAEAAGRSGQSGPMNLS